jgi:hypothetical protein
MRLRNTAILFTSLALAAAAPGASMSAPAAKPVGHTPRPVQDVGRADLFHGYACGNDCSIHQSGYKWGADHRIVNPADCRGTSESFIEGCRAFAGIDGPLGEREIFQDED